MISRSLVKLVTAKRQSQSPPARTRCDLDGSCNTKINGIEASKEIKKIQPKARILVLTSYAEDKQVADAIRAGAYGSLLKDTSPDELVQIIHSVYANTLTLPRELI